LLYKRLHDQLIIMNRRFGTHPAEDTNSFHEIPFLKYLAILSFILLGPIIAFMA
jgi:hypothetical protein